MQLRSVLKFALNTAADLLAAFTANGQMGYRTDSTEGFVGRVAGTDKRFLMEGDVVATAPASDVQTGVVQIATTAEFDAGTDDDGSGNPLVVKPSDLRAELNTKIEIGGDLTGTFDAPLVASSTQNGGLLIRDAAATQQGRIKATGAAELSARTAADDAYADFHVDDLTVHGNLSIIGNTTTVNSTDLSITDNEIVLNKDEIGAGVTAGTAGIRIKRGTAADALLQFNETTLAFEAGIEGVNVTQLPRKYAGTLGVAATSHVVTHNLNTKDVTVSVYDGDELVMCDIFTSTVNTITLNFSFAVTGYRVVVVG
jgi:hypothetical protein